MFCHQMQQGFDWLESAFVYSLAGTLAALGWWFALCGQHVADVSADRLDGE
ncbi:MAG TPA: hypothetical protein VGH74_13905 [Planctomycetaceae bacterium]|jgi:hypothetical protein